MGSPMPITLLPPRTHFGQAVKSRDLNGLAVRVGAHEPGEDVPAHQHADEHQWSLVLAGGFEEIVGGRSAGCSVGSFLVRPADCVHADRFGGGRTVCLGLFPSALAVVARV